jgi:[acyl-carrier-protein] S-malonyltransferase
MPVAFLFPGQGAQFVGMGQALYEAEPAARRAFDRAAEGSGLDLQTLCFSGPAERLAETEVTQPAILAVSAAVLAVLRERGVVPAAAAGLSLGEYGALLAAEAAEVGDLAALVRRRGRYMQEAVPLGEGAMAAVLGLERAAVEALCARALEALARDGVPPPPGGWVLAPANLNGPGQVVISGHAPAVRQAAALGREFGARRVTLLPVSAPFHCPLMRPAAQRLRSDLEALPLRPAAIPVVCNVRAEVVREPEEVRQALLDQVASPVLWEDCVRRLAALGCDTFLEVGPGQTLTALVGRILPGARAMAVGDPASLERCLAELGAA